MRPNIDLDDSLHGSVKEVKKRHPDIETIDEAYDLVVSRGVQNLSIPDGTAPDLSKAVGHTVRCHAPTARMVPGITHLPYPLQTDTPVAVTAGPSSVDARSARDLVGVLDDLSSGSPAQPVATFAQSEFRWFSWGADEIATQLEHIASRWDDIEGDLHHHEEVLIAARVSSEMTAFLRCRATDDGSGYGVHLSDAKLTLLLDGYPVTGNRVAGIVRRFGFDDWLQATPVEVTSQLVTDPPAPNRVGTMRFTDDDINEYVLKDGTIAGTPVKTQVGFLVENPFPDRDYLERALAGTGVVNDELVEFLLAQEQVFVTVLENPVHGDVQSDAYEVQRMRFTGLGEIAAVPGGLYNLTIEARPA